MDADPGLSSHLRSILFVMLLDAVFGAVALVIGWPVFDPFNLFLVGISVFALVVAVLWVASLFTPAARVTRDPHCKEGLEFHEYVSKEIKPGLPASGPPLPRSSRLLRKFAFPMTNIGMHVLVAALLAMGLSLVLTWAR